MIANVSAHRRANAFAQALEEQSDRGAAAEQSEGSAPAPAAAQSEQARLLALASGLGALPKPELDPEVKVVQRAQLVAAFEAMLQEGTAAGEATDRAVPEQHSRRARGAHRAAPLGKLRPRSRLAKGLTAGGLTVGVAAGALGGVAAASSDALPGDSLYGLKRGIEDVRLGLADGNDERGRVYLNHASTRLGEARRLMARGRSGPLDHESLGEIRRALSGMRHDASEGHRLLRQAYQRDPDSLSPLQTLSSFSHAHRESWGTLRDRLPVQLGDVSEQVSSVFDAIDQDVAPLQSLLPSSPTQDGGGGTPRRGSASSPGAPSDTGPSQSPGTGTSAESGTSSDGPSDSADTGGESDGLLGGNTGGLLDPPEESGAGTSPPASADPTPPPAPDVTLPPLLPGLLPGLGIDGEHGG
ncbi:DUF5667 domain-containing protein [Streptomyces griseoloalbus]|uniref:DUF5667 domain-containing protein n=1 Tax=Streptomyces griseoloalbus TaxID=67303 RepID=A0A7W8BLY3_9ACTN|nr:DUF5667 domain-containing protein [Streptomyces albaduncus]MBB5123869.1 hypothetical protein [Streptomyces albaduncus]GGW77974.1 hypothetical protein GCM10010340_65710 [Streptomyces albaduncus]